MKKVLTMLVALMFVFAVGTVAFAADKPAAKPAEVAKPAAKPAEAAKPADVKGAVTKIDGKKLTLKQADGKEAVVEVKDATGIKVGDNVTVKDGVASKEVAKPAEPAKKK